jgi:hypothetical protein
MAVMAMTNIATATMAGDRIVARRPAIHTDLPHIAMIIATTMALTGGMAAITARNTPITNPGTIATIPTEMLAPPECLLPLLPVILNHPHLGVAEMNTGLPKVTSPSE